MLGTTKRLAEIYCQALDGDVRARAGPGRPPMRLIAVRFGNVLASNGSVVPKFKARIEHGGPVTVPHRDMVRYFMTIREACDLVVTAASHALGSQVGDTSVYVLDMGQPVRIVDLAERMIRLLGLEPGPGGIEIVFSGIRPGERLHEGLFAAHGPTADIGVCGIKAARPVNPASTRCAPGSPPSNRASAVTTARRSTACCATRCRGSAKQGVQNGGRSRVEAFRFMLTHFIS
jgi:FlaA1/EpsC-like NDP-sugar epimerase